MTKRMLIGILVCSAMMFGAVQAHGEDAGPGRWWRAPGLAKDLGLTDREKQTLDDMFARNRNTLIDLKGDLDKERLKLEDVLEKDPVDESAAKTQFKRVEEKRQRLASERFKYILEVRRMLGPERFSILTGKFEEMKRKRHDRPGEGPWTREWR